MICCKCRDHSSVLPVYEYKASNGSLMADDDYPGAASFNELTEAQTGPAAERPTTVWSFLSLLLLLSFIIFMTWFIKSESC